MQATKISANTPERLQQPKPLPSSIFNQLSRCRGTRHSQTHTELLHTSRKKQTRRSAQKTQAVNWNFLFVLHAPTRTNANTRSCRLHPTKKNLYLAQFTQGCTRSLEPRAQVWRESELEGSRGLLMVLGAFHLSQHLRQFDGKVWPELGCKTKQLQSAHARADADQRRAQLRLIFLARR